MLKRIAFGTLLSCILLCAGCKDRSSVADYQKYKGKTEPVVIALEKVKDDLGRNASAKVVSDDFTAAQSAYDRWNGSLTEKERELDSARTVPVVVYGYRQVSMNLGRSAKPGVLVEMTTPPAQALGTVKQMLEQGR